MTKRSSLSDAFVMPIRGVTLIRGGRKPSSAIRKSDVGEVTSLPLSRSRVMPKASARRPGPLVSFRETLRRPIKVEGECIKQAGTTGLFAKLTVAANLLGDLVKR